MLPVNVGIRSRVNGGENYTFDVFLHIPTVVITLSVLGSGIPGEVGVVDVMITRKLGMLIKSSCKHLNCAFVYSLI